MKKYMNRLIVSLLFFSELACSSEIVFEWKRSKKESEEALSIQDRWVSSLLQDLFRCELEKHLLDLGVSYRLQLEKDVPSSSFSVFFDDKDRDSIGQIKNHLEEKSFELLGGFFEIQRQWSSWIEKEMLFSIDSTYAKFLLDSKKAVEEITLQNLEDLIRSFSFVKKEKSHELELFFSLPLEKEEEELARQLVVDLANKSIFEILAERESLLVMKERLRPVHPLRLIGFFLKEPGLSLYIQQIKRSEVKWLFLTSGLERSMKRSEEAGLLTPYIKGFCEWIEIDQGVIQEHLDQKKYGAMLRYLVSLFI